MKSWTWKNAVSFIFYTFPSLLIFLHFRRTHIRFFLAPFFPQLLYYLVIACPVLLWFCFCFIPHPSLIFAFLFSCYILLLLIIQLYSCRRIVSCRRWPALLYILVSSHRADPVKTLEIWLIFETWHYWEVVNHVLLWLTGTAKQEEGEGKVKKKKLLRLMFVKQFLCVKAKNCLCNVKIGSQKDSFLLCWCMLHWWHVRPC